MRGENPRWRGSVCQQHGGAEQNLQVPLTYSVLFSADFAVYLNFSFVIKIINKSTSVSFTRRVIDSTLESKCCLFVLIFYV
jgi:hypothetical protein